MKSTILRGVSADGKSKPMHVFDDFRGTVKSDVPLAPLVWFRLGGPAAYFANPRQLDELVALLKRCRQEGIAFKILGGGSNVLVRDEGVDAPGDPSGEPVLFRPDRAGQCRGGRRGGSAHGLDLAFGAGRAWAASRS